MSSTSVMNINGQHYTVYHSKKCVNSIESKGFFFSSDVTISTSMEKAYAIWLAPQSSSFDADKSRNLCIAKQEGADRFFLFPIPIYAKMQGRTEEEVDFDALFLEEVMQNDTAQFKQVKEHYSQRSGRFSSLVFAQTLSDLEFSKIGNMRIVTPQFTQGGFCRALDGSLRFVTRGIIDHLEGITEDGERLPIKVNIQFTETYRVNSVSCRIAPFPDSIAVSGSDADLFKDLFFDDLASQELAKLIIEPARIYQHDDLITLIKRTKFELFQDPLSFQMRFNNLCKILELMIIKHFEREYPSELEKNREQEELCNRVKELRELLSFLNTKKITHLAEFYLHSLLPIGKGKLEQLDKLLGIRIDAGQDQTARTATVVYQSSTERGDRDSSLEQG